MRSLLVAMTLVFALSAQADEYSNTEYGVSLTVPNDWEITNSAKLKVDLRSLSNEQLSELSQAYERHGVLGLRRQSDEGPIYVCVKIVFSEKGVVGPKEAAKNRIDESQQSVAPLTEVNLGDVAAGYFATKRQSGRSFNTHEFVISRSRSYLVVVATFPAGDPIPQRKVVEKLFERSKLDLEADKLN